MEPIISFNCDNQLNRLLNLRDTIQKYQPMALALQDLPRESQKELESTIETITQPHRYNVTMGPISSKSHKIDTAILTHSKHTSKGIIQTSKTENRNASYTATLITTNPQQRKVIIISTYIRPKAKSEEVEKLLNNIEETTKKHGHSNIAITGDVNATSSNWTPANQVFENEQAGEGWYNNIKRNRGLAIDRFTQKLRLVCLNQSDQGPTFTRTNGKESYIDIALIGVKIARYYNRLKLEETINHRSGHKAIVILPKNRSPTKQSEYQNNHRPCYNLKLIKEDMFTEYKIRTQNIVYNYLGLNERQMEERMNLLGNILYSTLIDIQSKIATNKKKQTENKLHNLDIHKTRRIISKIKKLEQHKRSIKRSKHTTQARKKINIKISNMKRQIIYIQKAANNPHNITNNEALWKAIKRIEGTINEQGDNGNNINDLEELERIAESKFPTNKGSAPSSNSRTQDIDKHHQQGSTLISNKEIDLAINEVKSKTYSGIEGTNFRVFNATIEYTIETIRAIAKISFRIGKTPECCRYTTGSIIPKKEAGKFRIVHISSPLAALLEQIALHRLRFWLEIGNHYSPYQFGFSAKRDRQDLVARMIETIIKNRILTGNSAHTDIISLDIEGAFDNIDHTYLLQTIKDKIPDQVLSNWISFFLLNRHIVIKYQNLQCKPRNITKGVPQGSSLGPILWNLSIDEIPVGLSIPGRLEMLTYADDIIICANNQPSDRVQRCIDNLCIQLRTRQLKINPNKCRHMITLNKASNTKHHTEHKTIYNIEGQEIESTKTINILGINITKELKLDTNSTGLKEKIHKQVRRLYNIKQADIIHSGHQWRTIIESLLISTLIQNNITILAIDKGATKWANTKLSTTLKHIFGWPTNASNKLTLLLAGINKAETYIEKLILKRQESEFRESYKLIERIHNSTLRKSGTYIDNEAKTVDDIICKELKIGYPEGCRRYPNPMATLEFEDDTNNTEHTTTNKANQTTATNATNRTNPNKRTSTSNQTNVFWTLHEKGWRSFLIEICHQDITQILSGTHKSYPIGLLNSIALLNKLMDNNGTIRNKTLKISKDSSITAALQNFASQDWRIIDLREKMHESGWRIIVDKENLVQSIEEKTNDKEQSAPNQLTITLRNGQRITNKQNIHLTLESPWIDDYKSLAHIKGQTRLKQLLEFNQLHTTITRALCNKAEIWLSIPPNWISAGVALMLTGMITCGKTNQIKSGKISNNNRTPERCQETECGAELGQPINGNNTDHILIHRVFHCNKYKEKQEKIKEILNEAWQDRHKQGKHYRDLKKYTSNIGTTPADHMEATLRHRMLSQKMLGTLRELVLPKITNANKP